MSIGMTWELYLIVNGENKPYGTLWRSTKTQLLYWCPEELPHLDYRGAWASFMLADQDKMQKVWHNMLKPFPLELGEKTSLRVWQL